MKKVLWVAVALMTAIGLGACSSDDDNDNGGEDVIWDIAPVTFSFTFTDSEGNDMLDSTYQGNIIKDVSVTYQGQEYPLVKWEDYERKMREQATTRVYLARFMGLILYETTSLDGKRHYYMSFGEFDGAESVDKREITLNLPTGQHFRVAYSRSYHQEYRKAPEIDTQFYLNGWAVSRLDHEGGQYGYFNFRYSTTDGFDYPPIYKR